ncbi:MAG TPA: hypothetical protein VF406_03145 [Thermodesulfobacteriota bacterium]
MRATGSFVLGAALALATAALPLPADAAGPSFSLAPIRFDIEATPGEPYTDALEVHNTARETARIKVYTEDWRLERDGAITFLKRGTGPRSASPWIRVNPSEFDLPPLSVADVRFTVTVPRGAPAGGYRAAIVVEQVPRPTPGEEPRRAVAIRARIASVVYVRVGAREPAAELAGVTYARLANGVRALVLAVRNTGDVHFRTNGKVRLADPATGRRVHTIPIPDAPVLPRSERDLLVHLPEDARPGTYAVRAELDVGGADLYVHEGQVRVD